MRINNEMDFDQLARGASLLTVASAWTDLGIWNILAEREAPIAVSELPGDSRALSIAATVLAHAGLLDGDGTQWRMSATAREMHARQQLPTERNLRWMDDLSRMSDVLRDGGPVKGADGTSKVSSGGVRPDDLEATRRFMDMLYRRSDAAADQLAQWLMPRLPAGGHVLDVGGGHGRYSRTLADRGYRATVFDMDIVVSLAKERHGDKLNYRVGNFHEDSFGGPYDAALLSNIVHGESDADNADMTRRLWAALSPGGWLVVKDMFIDEQVRGPEHAAFFGLTMLYYTAQGRSYTLRDVSRWCEAAGFAAQEAIGVGTQTLVFARKPA